MRLWLFFVSLPPVGLFLLHWLSRPAMAFPPVSECFCVLVHVLVHVLRVVQCVMRCSVSIVCVGAVTIVALPVLLMKRISGSIAFSDVRI
ncbi:hypothetical protein P692DRAFT_20403942 [Suillus brevipes Sb2]|nr:hypothetical protein P692DRAFT_20403942 [Suillus brevipes Sb2]